ncbi:outer membrane protein assembly factor BamD [Nitratifractor sp.]
MGRWKRYALAAAAVMVLGGCAGDGGDKALPAPKSAGGWYDTILRSVASGDLERADKEYLSMREAYEGSSLLPMTMLMLAQAHMAEEEYLLADYYLEEFLKIRGGGPYGEYARFLRLKARYLGIRDIDRDQKLVEDTLALVRSFYRAYGSSRYAPIVRDMIVRLEMGNYLLNDRIARLYEKEGKSKGAEIYRKKNADIPYKTQAIESPSGFLSTLNPFH